MKYPILYNSNETDFFTMGLGPIEMSKATVTQERNGIFIFEGEILTDNPLFPLVLENYIIKADADHLLKDQRFRIKRVVPNHNGKAQIYAEHVSYLSRELTIKPEVSITGSAQVALNQWKSSIVEQNPFIVSSDITTSASTKWRIDKVSNPMMALGGVEGSILDRWGGEYLFDNYHIRLLKKRGTTAQTVLAYGRNITDFEQERNILSTYTSVAPYAIYTDDNEKEIIVTIDGYVVDSEHIDKYPNRVTMPIDFSSEFGHGEMPTKARLATLAQQYIEDNEIGVPTTSIKISFLDLSQTADYADYAFLEQVNLCDDVRVHYPKLGVNTIAKVVRVVWNCLTESYDEIEIGQKRMSLASQIQEQNKVIQEINTQVNQSQVSADGKNMIFYGLYGTDGLGQPNATKIGDSWFKPNGLETEFYVWTGIEWKLIMDTSDTTKNAREIEATMEEVEEAKRQAKSDAEQALVDAKAHADAEVERIDAELTTEIGGAIDLAEQAKADAVTKANQALADAKVYADAEVQASKEHFDGVLAEVESDVADAQATADSAIEQIDTAVANAGFTSLDDTLQNMNYITTKADQSAQQAITDASDAYGLAQTSISEAQTAQANSLTALSKADNALDGVSNLDVRVDDVEAELELKADNAFMTEDGELITLSNAITFNAHRFSSDMSRIESRVESLAGEINLVILRGSIENHVLYGSEVFPNAVASSSFNSNVMGELIDVVGGETFALSKELTGANDRWRINFYDENHNYISRFSPLANTQDIMNAPLNARYMWVAYPQNSKPQITRGTDFIPYRPNLADQMTADEVTIFRNEYDEFADKTERRLTSIDSTGGRLETAELLITQTADGLALKADQTTVDELTGEVESLGTEFNIVAGQVSSKVWNTDIESAVDGIEIGGRNLVLNTQGEHEPRLGGFNIYTLPLTSSSMFLGQELTFSFKAKSSNGTNRMYISIGTGSQSRNNITGNIVIPKDYKEFKYTFTSSTSTDTTKLMIVAGDSWFSGNEGSITITDIKLEKGNKATDWSPAPEDTEAKIDYIETEWTQTFESFEQTITGEGGINTQLQTLDSTMSSIVDPVTGRLSIVEQIAGGLESTVADKASQTQVTQLSDLLSSTVEDVEGNTSQISQLAENINLRVEKDDVIHQINVSTEGILIDGKKTHITGTTTIDDGVIKNAHISNLNADKINAGTIDTARLDAKLIVTEGLEVDVIEAEHIKADTATIEKLFATEANINTLTAKTAFIDSIKAVEIDASKITSGTINTARLNAKEIITEGLVANVIKSTHISADTALFDKLFTSTLATDRLSAQTAWITNGMFANASIDGAKITNATIGSAKIVSLDASKISVGTLTGHTILGAVINGGTITQSDTGGYSLKMHSGKLDMFRDSDLIMRLAPTYNASPMKPNGAAIIQVPGEVFGIGTQRTNNETFNYVFQIPETSHAGDIRWNLFGQGNDIKVSSVNVGSDGAVRKIFADASNNKMRIGSDHGVIIGVRQVHGGYFDVFDGTGTTINLHGGGANTSSNRGAGISFGRDGGTNAGGARIWSLSLYQRTYSSAANMYITTDGTIGRAVSARKYKTDIQSEHLSKAKTVLQISPSSWHDKVELTNGKATKRYYGFIADDFHELGLTEVVQYGADGQVEGLAYDRISMYHNVILQDHEQQLATVTQQLNSVANNRLQETLLLESRLLSLQKTVEQLQQEIEQLRTA